MLDGTDQFARFWSVYPRRAGSAAKAMARVKFYKIIKTVDSEVIISGARRYADDNKAKIGTEFICMAQTWLHQRRWEDYEAADLAPKYTPEELEAGREWYRRKQAQAAD